MPAIAGTVLVVKPGMAAQSSAVVVCVSERGSEGHLAHHKNEMQGGGVRDQKPARMHNPKPKLRWDSTRQPLHEPRTARRRVEGGNGTNDEAYVPCLVVSSRCRHTREGRIIVHPRSAGAPCMSPFRARSGELRAATCVPTILAITFGSALLSDWCSRDRGGNILCWCSAAKSLSAQP